MKPEDLIEIFPNDRDRFTVPIIAEKRRGGEPTKKLNDEFVACFNKAADEAGVTVKEQFGARKDGKEIPELYLPRRKKFRNPIRPRHGSNYLDVAFQILDEAGDPDYRFLINTVDTYVDGITLKPREVDAAFRIVQKKLPKDTFVLVPKLKEGQTFDCDHFREILKTILDKTQDNPASADHGGIELQHP